MSAQVQLSASERQEVERRVALITRHKAFSAWLHKAEELLAAGYNVAAIRRHLPTPHALDDYETKRVIEEGVI